MEDKKILNNLSEHVDAIAQSLLNQGHPNSRVRWALIAALQNLINQEHKTVRAVFYQDLIEYIKSVFKKEYENRQRLESEFPDRFDEIWPKIQAVINEFASDFRLENEQHERTYRWNFEKEYKKILKDLETESDG